MTIRAILPYLFLALAVVLTFAFLNLPGTTLFWRALQNSGHVIAFAGLSIMAMRILFQLKTPPTLTNFLSLAIGLSAIGLTIELVQHGTGRGASLSDLILNTAGIVCGCCTAALFLPTDQGKRYWIKGLLLIMGSVTTMAWGLRWPLVYAFAGLQRPPIPVLENFENVSARHFIAGNNSMRYISQHTEWTDNLSHSLKVQFLPGRYPNVRFLEPEKDWSMFTTLNFNIYNPSNNPIAVQVRIDDTSLGHLNENHMTVQEVVPIGNHAVKLDLDLFKEDAMKRTRPGHATFKQIDAFMVYLKRNEVATTLYFDDFLLQ